MGNHKVSYLGGESRTQPGTAVDYMTVTVDGVELYAETETNPDDDTATYDGLKAEILRQAAGMSIPADALQFCYDS